MIQIILLILLFFALAITVVTGCAAAILIVVKKCRNKQTGQAVRRLKGTGLFLGVMVMAVGGLFLFSGLTAHTPQILNQQGEPLEGSIAELQKVTLNGRREWISIRGENEQNPVLLFLAGGPGGTQMAAVRHELSQLEKELIDYSLAMELAQGNNHKQFEMLMRR